MLKKDEYQEKPLRFRDYLALGLLIVILVWMATNDRLPQKEIPQTPSIIGSAEIQPQLIPSSEANELNCPAADHSKIYQKVASNYGDGDGFDGEKASDGSVYDQEGFTCAHKHWPLGTVLEVKNPENGKAVLLRLTDRGPYYEGRHIDLSSAAARAIGVKEQGVAEVHVRVFRVGPPMYFVAQLVASPYQEDIANHLQIIQGYLPQETWVTETYRVENSAGEIIDMYRLVSQKFDSRAPAERIVQMVKQKDLQDSHRRERHQKYFQTAFSVERQTGRDRVIATATHEPSFRLASR